MGSVSILLRLLELNYTYYDGLAAEDGFLVEYYANNNMQGLPFLSEVVSSIYLNSANANWAYVHAKMRDFSVRISGLIKPLYTESYQFTTGLTSNLEIWIDSNLVLTRGATTSSSVKLKENKWT